MNVSLHNGDCLAVMASLADNSVDSIVTDPPYGISFMGQKWDYDVPSVAIWTECLRVLKPGGHLLAFAGARTQHRMATNIEDAGFEIRDMVTYLYDTNETARALVESLTPEQLKLLDATFGRDNMLAWVYGSGFPKSHNLKNAWEGWGTALKPALEPITMARKPFKGSVAANVLAHGTGALNIDGCRVQWPDGKAPELGTPGWGGPAKKLTAVPGQEGETVERSQPSELGRWPANLMHDGSESVTEIFPHSTSGAMKADSKRAAQNEAGSVCYGTFGGNIVRKDVKSSSGSTARFFYCPKITSKDRHEGLVNPGPQFQHNGTLRQYENTGNKGNNHPTVKPTELMRWLCRLVTPPGGVILDPFMGSGSTGKGALLDGFDFIGIELDVDSFHIAIARILVVYPDRPTIVIWHEHLVTVTLGTIECDIQPRPQNFPITYGSICSGIEAASLAWEPLGFKPAWFSEIAPFPAAVLAHRWPEVVNLGDMTQLAEQVRAGSVVAPAVLVGGTPCQAFSVFGAREGLSDPRGQLTISYVELADAIDDTRAAAGLQPAIIVWENVPGVLLSEDNAFGAFLGFLAGEDCELQPPGGKWEHVGYVRGPRRTIAWRVLNAQYFDVPQRRCRVYVVASARNDINPAEILFECEGLRGASATGLEASGYAGFNAEDAGTDLGDLDGHGKQVVAFGGGRRSGAIDVAACLTAHGHRIDFEVETFVVEYTGFSDAPAPNSQMAVRRLTPVECERLQGFPDNWTLIPTRKRKRLTSEEYTYLRHHFPNITAEEAYHLAADGPRYKAIGNSMAVPVMHWIGQRILNQLNITPVNEVSL